MALLEMRNVTHYFGGLRAVYNLNLRLEGGELMALIGPNGAGKTTMFNLVSGFYRPTEGEIIFNGKEILGLRPHQVTALGMARTFQNIRLWNSLTVFDNLCISQHYHLGYGFFQAVLRTRRFRENERRVKKTADEILEILGLRHYAQEYPKNLPYGLQRRVEIGRALSIRPKLLLLDEPAAGMNPDETEHLMQLIGRIRNEFKLSILVIEHHMDLIMGVCEKIVVLNFGVKLAEGRADEVANNPKVIEAYLGATEEA